MDKVKLAKDILQNVGGPQNVSGLVYCATRLRFSLVDAKKADRTRLEDLDGVITVIESMGQCQVVVGNIVADLYAELEKLLPDIKTTEAKLEGNIFTRIMSTFTNIFVPAIPALAGTGMIKGILALAAIVFMNTSGVDIKVTQTYIIINAIADSLFYFFPIILAYSAAKAFKTNEIVAMVLGGSLCYPSLLALMSGEEALYFLGIPITKAVYNGSIIPVILAVFALSYVYRFFDRIMPEVIKVIMVPALSLLVMVPVTLIAIGPIGIYIGMGMNAVYYFVYNFSPALCGAFIGGIWCILVSFGIHKTLLPIPINDLEITGRQNFLAFSGAANFSQAGAAMGVFLKSRNKKLKATALSGSITALFGITEPAIYGANLRLKKPMLCAIVSGAAAGAVMGIGGVYGTGWGNQGLLTIPLYAEVGLAPFIAYLIGNCVAFFGAATLTFIVGFQDIVEKEDQPEKGEAAYHCLDLVSPVNGETIDIKQVKDEVFSSEAIGRGIAVMPSEGIAYAPEDGVVASLYPSMHAIGMSLDNGIEVLVHIGINTVELAGKYFTAHVEQGQRVGKGDKLISFEMENIKQAGYDMTTIIIVTNTFKFDDVSFSKNYLASKDSILISIT